jgi:hypothetical protein
MVICALSICMGVVWGCKGAEHKVDATPLLQQLHQPDHHNHDGGPCEGNDYNDEGAIQGLPPSLTCSTD